MGPPEQNGTARMSSKNPPNDNDRLDRLVADARRYREEREQDYREQALKLYPWVCGRCGREFTRENLRELTVHHVDHDHANNPPDGSNWELLCLYCHDHEHQKHEDRVRYGDGLDAGEGQGPATHNPFAGLKDLLKDK